MLGDFKGCDNSEMPECLDCFLSVQLFFFLVLQELWIQEGCLDA